jgi:hypothetical protein
MFLIGLKVCVEIPFFKIIDNGLVMACTPVIPALRKLRQEDH